MAFYDPRTPWYAKAWLALVLGYLASSVDLIPDLIPVLGHLDDLLLVPAGLALATRMIPKEVLEDCRRMAAFSVTERRLVSRRLVTVAIVTMLVLVLAAALIAYAAVSRSRLHRDPKTAGQEAAADSTINGFIEPDSSESILFELRCRRPNAARLLEALAGDSVTDLSKTLVRARVSKDRFVKSFHARMVTREGGLKFAPGFLRTDVSGRLPLFRKVPEHNFRPQSARPPDRITI